MNRDELYPIIDEVLSERMFPHMNAGSYWIEQSDGDVQLCTYELAEALCDALCKAVGDLTADRDASRLIISDLTAEVDRLWEQNHELSTRYVELLDTLDATRFERDRLRDAGDALAQAAVFRPQGYVHAAIVAWQEARRER